MKIINIAYTTKEALVLQLSERKERVQKKDQRERFTTVKRSFIGLRITLKLLT